ncbi:MAG: hypothetical protein JOY77_00675 [Alphaproteobacteria bacterium]|nr:hypothetical protein [Alphaproteobacteria bacterium]
MMGRVSKRRIGLGAAFIAAYALVFNVVLTSILFASSPAMASEAAHELCLAQMGGSSVPADADKNGHKIAIHCPLCASHHVANGTPPESTDVVGALFHRHAEVVYAFKKRRLERPDPSTTCLADPLA